MELSLKATDCQSSLPYLFHDPLGLSDSLTLHPSEESAGWLPRLSDLGPVV